MMTTLRMCQNSNHMMSITGYYLLSHVAPLKSDMNRKMATQHTNSHEFSCVGVILLQFQRWWQCSLRHSRPCPYPGLFCCKMWWGSTGSWPTALRAGAEIKSLICYNVEHVFFRLAELVDACLLIWRCSNQMFCLLRMFYAFETL